VALAGGSSARGTAPKSLRALPGVRYRGGELQCARPDHRLGRRRPRSTQPWAAAKDRGIKKVHFPETSPEPTTAALMEAGARPRLPHTLSTYRLAGRKLTVFSNTTGQVVAETRTDPRGVGQTSRVICTLGGLHAQFAWPRRRHGVSTSVAPAPCWPPQSRRRTDKSWIVKSFAELAELPA